MLTSFQSLVLNACRLYNVFGSGVNRGIHAQFMTQASALNNGKRIGLLRGAGTRFGPWFHALHRLLEGSFGNCPQSIFYLSGPQCNKSTGSSRHWKQSAVELYFLLRAMFPALRTLRSCNANKPAIDKIYYLCDCAKKALLRCNSLF